MSELKKYRPTLDKKFVYKELLDVAILFRQENISYVFNHIFGAFYDEALACNRMGIEFHEPIILSKKYGVFNIEYGYLIDRLAELFEDNLAFKSDFQFSWENKNALFLVVAIFEETLGLCKMNSRVIQTRGKPQVTYYPNFARSCIVQYPKIGSETEAYIQMNAVTFRMFELIKVLDKELYSELAGWFEMSLYKQVDGIFGRQACTQFWNLKGYMASYGE